jgi:predicted metal-dependent phosphoesterase TrpH
MVAVFMSAVARPAAQDAAALRRVFEGVNAASCPTSYNFHMHTNHSDGQLRPDLLIDQAIKIGLKGFAITDHHQVSGLRVAQAYLAEGLQSAPQTGSDAPMPHLWTGVEITSELLDTEVHILGYAFDPEHSAIAAYFTGKAPQGAMGAADRVIAAIHQAGGLAILAHPARYRKSKEDLIPAAADRGIDGVETYYAYGNSKPWQPSPKESAEVQLLSERYHLLNTCGTDTHGTNLLQRV